MFFSQESSEIRTGLGEFLQQLVYVDRRWIRIDSCNNNTIIPQGGTEEINCPIRAFSDVLGISAKRANDYLRAAKLLEPHPVHKDSMGLNRKGWEDLIREYCLDIEVEQASDNKYLGRKVYVLRIGCLCNHNNNTTFNAKIQAKRFFVATADFEKGWEPKRLRATSQANSFLNDTTFALSIFKAEELAQFMSDEDSDSGGEDSDDDCAEMMSSSAAFQTPVRDKEVKFDMKVAKTSPIQWTSPNGTQRTAVCVPRTATRQSFRKSAKQTGWIKNVIESMFKEDKVPEEVGVDWLVEGIYDRFRPYFESFCVRKGFALPVTARMPPDRTAAMWTDANVSYTTQRTISKHCHEHFRRWIFAKEKDVYGFGDTAMKPTIGVYRTETNTHIFYWWKPPDDLLQNEINSLLDEENINKLVSVDFSTGGGHGKGRYRHLLTLALRFEENKSIIRRFVIGEI